MGRWLANVFRLTIKELASLASDKVLAFFVVYSFSFSVYSESTGITTDVNNAPIAIVDSDRSVLSTRIADALFLERHMRWFVTTKQRHLKAIAEGE